MQKIQNSKSDITIEELHEEQDREINKYYYNNESFFEIICNEYYNHIHETIKFILFGLFWKK